MDYDDIIRAIAERVRPLKEASFRARRTAHEFSRFSDEEVAHLFDELYRQAIRKNRNSLALLRDMTDFSIVRECFGRRLSTIFDIADRQGLLLATEWLAPLPIRKPKPKNLQAHQDLQDMTLGERKWHARKASPLLLEKLLVDPDPAVIKNLLRHPQLKEEHVIKICARRPNHPEALRQVVEHPKWFARYRVKTALLNNPDTPPRLVMLILPSLSLPDLRSLYKSRRFSLGFLEQIMAVRRGESETNETPEAKSQNPTEPSSLTASDRAPSSPENTPWFDDSDDQEPQLH